ncbi:hypothetical protein ScPMuIL_013663 [Solemya velum]
MGRDDGAGGELLFSRPGKITERRLAELFSKLVSRASRQVRRSSGKLTWALSGMSPERVSRSERSISPRSVALTPCLIVENITVIKTSLSGYDDSFMDEIKASYFAGSRRCESVLRKMRYLVFVLMYIVCFKITKTSRLEGSDPANNHHQLFNWQDIPEGYDFRSNGVTEKRMDNYRYEKVALRDNSNSRQREEYVLLYHGNQRRRIRKKRFINGRPLLPRNATVLDCNDLPSDSRFWPTIGNGHVASVVHTDGMFMNGLYNGKATGSHRARIPSTCAVNVTSTSRSLIKSKFTLDLARGMFIEQKSGENFYIAQRMYAHRTVNRLLVTELSVQNAHSQPLDIHLQVNSGAPSPDLDLQNGTTTLPLFPLFISRYIHGLTKEAEYNVSGLLPVHVFHTDVPNRIRVYPNVMVTYLFLTSIGHAKSEAEDNYRAGVKSFLAGTLSSSHVAGWTRLWKEGRIDVEGNLPLARANYASLYYILSSLPLQPDVTWPYVGLSPGDLAHGVNKQDYMGHVFWDQETWMFPPILMMYADLGELLIHTRIRTLAAAKDYAISRGFRGAMYPWESAYTGLNVCPSTECAIYEQHITGDIAFAFKQYLMMTNDTSLMWGLGADLVISTADFWASRVEFNRSTNKYEINKVMPPDEYSSRVNNSVYTNTVARLNLELPEYALGLIGQRPPRTYKTIANNIYIPFNVSHNYHPEYDGYKEGMMVKQADVVLLGFPLTIPLSPQVRRNDLEIYEKVGDTGGPAMTWSMFAIGWLELGEVQAAEELFQKQFLNIQSPFNVWSEVAHGLGAVNFLTGMGGYLQSIVFGYGGFRIHEDRLDFNGKLPPQTTSFTVVNLDYLGGSMDFKFTTEEMTITLKRFSSRSFSIRIKSSGRSHALTLHQPVTLSAEAASIVSSAP